MRLDNRRVVITAAGRDFGRTLAIRLADLGAEVFLSARELAAAHRVRDELRDRGHQRVHAFACDHRHGPDDEEFPCPSCTTRRPPTS